ncbi:hypothetical protein PoB_003519100 [Plakobranchus ocellatus]|uniref:Uncharacterized protein n=1 Tax=Plakobranchus ocellatus TaxID=259542 RepID=A0AAV4AQ27_9GAST|nr:hypothetical protein PoB_003519100 [Plakobranchus ocellatus]
MENICMRYARNWYHSLPLNMPAKDPRFKMARQEHVTMQMLTQQLHYSDTVGASVGGSKSSNTRSPTPLKTSVQ